MIRYREISTGVSDHQQVKNEVVRQHDMSRLKLCARILPKDVNSLLDVGTKTGYFCRLLQDQGIAAEGIDDTIRGNIEAGVKVTRGDIRDLPFDDNAFDCVTAFEILEHLTYPDSVQAIRELKRVARKHVMISVPYREFPIREVNHLQNFSERKLRTMLGTSVTFYSFQDNPIEPQPLLLRVLNKCIRLTGVQGRRIAWLQAKWIIAHIDLSKQHKLAD